MARILVIEDDPWSRHITLELLQRRGHEVHWADDLASARAALVAGMTPELVLMDIHIPGGSGEELIAEIRETTGYAQLPVIALTASAMTGDRERFLDQGFTAYISKPVDVKTFAQSVESFLRARKG